MQKNSSAKQYFAKLRVRYRNYTKRVEFIMNSTINQIIQIRQMNKVKNWWIFFIRGVRKMTFVGVQCVAELDVP